MIAGVEGVLLPSVGTAPLMCELAAVLAKPVWKETA